MFLSFNNQAQVMRSYRRYYSKPFAD
ncbi:hypothetical protein DFAR_1430006 [Desulfarculales bacterium]